MNPLIGLIIVSHGPLAKGFYESNLFFCENFQNIGYLILNADDNPFEFQNRIEDLYMSMNSSEGVIILTDIPGGSPANQALIVAQRHDNIRVISGINLMMMIEASLGREHDQIDDLCETLLKSARESITLLSSNQLISTDDDINSEF